MKYSNEKLEHLRSRWNTLKGRRLVKKIKETRCYLSPVLFRKVVQNFAYINDTEVTEGIDLRGINLSGFDFRVPVLEDDSGFEEEMAILSFIHFEGAALRHTTFQDGKIHDCSFEDADLSHTNLKNASINTCNLEDADLSGANLSGANIINSNLLRTSLRDVNLGAVLIDQKSVLNKQIHDETEGNHHLASIQYKQIKQMYKNSSLHSMADDYQYREMVCKRRALKWYNPVRWLNFVFGDLSCKYGTSVTRIAFWMIFFVCGFAWIFHHLQNIRYYEKPFDLSYLDSLYFSLVTYTTVGYGDLHMVGPFRILAGIEGIIGITITSLFTVIVARKIIRD